MERTKEGARALRGGCCGVQAKQQRYRYMFWTHRHVSGSTKAHIVVSGGSDPIIATIYFLGSFCIFRFFLGLLFDALDSVSSRF